MKILFLDVNPRTGCAFALVNYMDSLGEKGLLIGQGIMTNIIGTNLEEMRTSLYSMDRTYFDQMDVCGIEYNGSSTGRGWTMRNHEFCMLFLGWLTGAYPKIPILSVHPETRHAYFGTGARQRQDKGKGMTKTQRRMYNKTQALLCWNTKYRKNYNVWITCHDIADCLLGAQYLWETMYFKINVLK